MIVGLVGLGLSGKSTIFNAVTRGHVEVGSFQTQKGAYHRGRVLVPDLRVDWLSGLSGSKNKVYAEVEYIDAAGFSGERESSVEAEIPQLLRDSDALAHVVRAFENPEVSHPKGAIDIRHDIEALNDELIFSDLVLIDKRLEKVERQAKLVKDEKVRHEYEVLGKVKSILEQNIPLRKVPFSSEEEKLIRGFRFLSEKPILIIINIGENDIARMEALAAEYGDLREQVHTDAVIICGKIEMELSELGDSDRQAFMSDLGLKESALDLIFRNSYELLGLISFLTSNDRETHAWTLKKGSTALMAAGTIHHDFERGFIRAEVVPFEELHRSGSYAEAKKKGVVRLEGKEYLVKDGDVILFRFNV